jgi:hypothetical protein
MDSDRVSTTSTTSQARVRIKSIALPPEHGAWGFLLEPMVLGLAVAPSLAGLFLAVGVVGAFLVRHPLKLAFADWKRHKRYERTRIAERVILVYGAAAVIGLALAAALAGWRSCCPWCWLYRWRWSCSPATFRIVGAISSRNWRSQRAGGDGFRGGYRWRRVGGHGVGVVGDPERAQPPLYPVCARPPAFGKR